MMKCKDCGFTGEIEEFEKVSMCSDNVGHGLHEEYTYVCPSCGVKSDDYEDLDSRIEFINNEINKETKDQTNVS